MCVPRLPLRTVHGRVALRCMDSIWSVTALEQIKCVDLPAQFSQVLKMERRERGRERERGAGRERERERQCAQSRIMIRRGLEGDKEKREWNKRGLYRPREREKEKERETDRQNALMCI